MSMTIFFASIIFLALSGVPETANQMTMTFPKPHIGVTEKLTFKRSADAWHVLGEDNGKPTETLLNFRGDRLFVTELKEDFPRVTAYLAALDETECDACNISLTLESHEFPPKTCDVHGEIPGIWIDVAQVLEKPEDGWPHAGELRFRTDEDDRVEFNAAEDGNGLDIDFVMFLCSDSPAVPDEYEYVKTTFRVRWSEAEE